MNSPFRWRRVPPPGPILRMGEHAQSTNLIYHRYETTCLQHRILGSSLVSAYWNGAATYYRGIIKELSRLGHSITFFEPDAFERQQHRDIPDPEWAEVVVYAAEESAVKKVLKQARTYDIVIKATDRKSVGEG